MQKLPKAQNIPSAVGSARQFEIKKKELRKWNKFGGQILYIDWKNLVRILFPFCLILPINFIIVIHSCAQNI